MLKPHLSFILSRLLNPRIQLAGVTLFVLLQRSPAVMRVVNGLKVSVEPATRILQKTTIAAASLGSHHALSGATIADYTASTGGSPDTNLQSFNLTVASGEAFQIVFSLQKVDGEGRTPGSWSLSNPVQPLPEGVLVRGFRGLTNFPLNNQNYFNAPNGTILGTPTQSGTFELRLKPWEDPDKGGRSAEPFLIRLTVEGSEPPIPPKASIQIQPTHITITWSKEDGQTYELQTSDSPLDTASWTNFPVSIKTSGAQQSATIEKSQVPKTLLIRVATNNEQ